PLKCIDNGYPVQSIDKTAPKVLKKKTLKLLWKLAAWIPPKLIEKAEGHMFSHSALLSLF
ncbi:MAG TPA: hypothetical protein DHW78_02985, partial [Ruminococcaceae bacterium]|nr:hypothetical protein [Oscillospiraceae bacterium]